MHPADMTYFILNELLCLFETAFLLPHPQVAFGNRLACSPEREERRFEALRKVGLCAPSGLELK